MTDADLVVARANALAHHSPLNFLRDPNAVAWQQQRYGTGVALRFGSKLEEEIIPFAATDGQWLLQRLTWDSAYFTTPTYRLFTGLFSEYILPDILVQEAIELRQQLAARGEYYIFSIVPVEDIALLQALTGSGWRLVETRLNFYCPVADAKLPAPVPVRLARPDEAEFVGRIAAAARNPYDRFHADPWFGSERADAFLARYAEATVAEGYASAVLLPDEPGLPVDSFLAIQNTPADDAMPSSGTSRVLLTAVGPQNRGWHQKLVAETVRRAAALSLPYVLMTTQATNIAVFRTCEKLGFRLGGVSHVLACHS